MSVALSQMIYTGHTTQTKKYIDIFDERLHRLEVKSTANAIGYEQYCDLTKPPSEEDIYLFINPIFHALKIKPESGVLAMVYIERLLYSTNLTFDPTNWRRVVLSSLILATKIYEELAVWNADFKEVFPKLSVKDLNELEKSLLAYLDYNLTLNSSMYVKYFFTLRGLSELDESHFPLKPLDNQGLAKLEISSRESEKVLRKMNSAGNLHKLTESGRAVLS